MEHINIMIVEDDESLSCELQKFLYRWNYTVAVATTFENIVDDFIRIKPDLILMDINLPFYDGYYWCHKIRDISQVPIIYISSRNEVSDQLMAIAQGGDDYVEKPLQLPLLKAKIDAMMRRCYEYKIDEKRYLTDSLCYDYQGSCLYYQQEKLDLTKSENIIIRVLTDHRNNIVTRNVLMDELWNTDEFISDNTLTVLISRLRSKMKDFCHCDIIHTKKGQGYFIQ